MLELVLDARAAIGESMLWVPEERQLYWADIKAPALHALAYETGVTRHWPVSADLGGFALDGKGRALLALRTGLHWLNLADGALERLVRPPFDERLIRFNESGCDAHGRFWVGTMTDPPHGVDTDQTGALYSFTRQAGLKAHPDFAEITNGMAWNRDESVLFLAHSREKTIFQYSYDSAAGRIGARQVFVQLQGAGIPDGAALDEAGYYWCAIHGAGVVHCYDPEGRLADRIELPVSKPTMCCFAGPDLDWLYITSARDGLDEEALAKEPLAGALFRMRAPRRGQKRYWRVA